MYLGSLTVSVFGCYIAHERALSVWFSRLELIHPILKEGVILNLFQDLIGPTAVDWRFRNKFGMTQRDVEIVS